jgi:hypothetical protein
MITVYFEKVGSFAEAVATFSSEELYMACLPALEAKAVEMGYVDVTESIDYKEQKPTKKKIKPKKEPLDAATYCYIRLYEESTPKANFLELPYMDRKSKFFLDYEIEESKLNDIMEETIKKFKIKHKIWKQAFRNTILLGCSPKTK